MRKLLSKDWKGFQYRTHPLRYWTNTKKGNLRFERTSLSSIQIWKGKQFIGAVSDHELYNTAEDIFTGEKFEKRPSKSGK